jgi:ferredoxin
MKNWVGICVGQDKRQMHNNLGLNIASLNANVPADLVIVDGIIGMEGNGPGDGTPVALKQLIVSSNSHLNDVVVSRLMNIDPTSIPYLSHALQRNDIDRELLEKAQAEITPLTTMERPPERPKLAVLSEHPWLTPLKMAMRPLTAQPEVLDLAYRFGIVQDVYHPLDAEVHSLKRTSEPCGPCTRCSDLCPTGIPLEKISSDHEDCLSCLQCWWACPTDGIEWHGIRGHLHRHIGKYRDPIKAIFDRVEAS